MLCWSRELTAHQTMVEMHGSQQRKMQKNTITTLKYTNVDRIPHSSIYWACVYLDKTAIEEGAADRSHAFGRRFV